MTLEPLLANPDVRDRPYTVRGEDGSVTTRTVTGVSLATVLKAAKADVDQFRFAEVQDGAGRSVLFSEGQALDAAWKGDGPPVFTVGPDGLRFLRPSGSAQDLNGPDELVHAAGMTIMLRRQIQPAIAVEASTQRPEVGEKVDFTATVSGVGAGEEVAISWVFGDGSTKGEGSEVSHTFRKKGTYKVLVTMTTPDDEVGASDIVTIEVGAPAEEEPEADAGTVTSPSTGGTADGTGSGAGGSGTGTGGGATSTAGTPAPAPEEPEQQPKRKRKRDEKPKEPVQQDTTIPGEVTGELLVADTTPVAAPARRSVVPRGDTSAGDDGAFGLSPAAWTGIGVGVALAAGFGLDRRRMGRLA